MTYPTAAEAREQAARTIYGASRSALTPAIERAQWAAVREALVEVGCLAEEPAVCGIRPCAVCDLRQTAERHLHEVLT